MRPRPLLLSASLAAALTLTPYVASAGVVTTLGGGTWTRAARMAEARQEVCAASIGSRIYVAGGIRVNITTADTVEVYDSVTNQWSFLAPLPHAVNHCMAAAVGNRVYVMGGSLASGDATAATFEYNPQVDAWTPKASMPTARSAGMAAVAGGRIYVAGGTPGGSALEVYDPATNQWAVLPAMPTPRNHLAGGVIAGRLFAVGGRPPLTLDVLEAFDFAAGTWSTLTPMPTGRSGHAAAVVGKCLYTFGGEGNPNDPNGVFAENEVYDPDTDTWDSLTPMPAPRHGLGAAAIGTRIFLPGGANVKGVGAVATHHVFTVPDVPACR